MNPSPAPNAPEERAGGAQRRRLDGGREYFHHGPIDLIIAVDAVEEVRHVALSRAWARFQPLLGELVSELGMLRQPISTCETVTPLSQGEPDSTSAMVSPLPPGEGQGVREKWGRTSLGLADGGFPHPNPSPGGRGATVPSSGLVQCDADRVATVQGAVARRMIAAVQPFAPRFVTPMAAVAGAVADEIIATLQLPGVRRCYVNNGGDIALHLTPRTHFSIGIRTPEGKSWKAVVLDGRVEIDHNSPVRGVATSGWRGRSFSLGIADSVTVLAINAAMADAAATMIANAVDVDSAQVKRAPANHIKDDTDLGDRLVTVEVGDLSQADIARALDAGVAAAHGMMAAGLIHAAALRLQGQSRTVGESLPAESESQRYKE